MRRLIKKCAGPKPEDGYDGLLSIEQSYSVQPSAHVQTQSAYHEKPVYIGRRRHQEHWSSHERGQVLSEEVESSMEAYSIQSGLKLVELRQFLDDEDANETATSDVSSDMLAYFYDQQALDTPPSDDYIQRILEKYQCTEMETSNESYDILPSSFCAPSKKIALRQNSENTSESSENSSMEADSTESSFFHFLPEGRKPEFSDGNSSLETATKDLFQREESNPPGRNVENFGEEYKRRQNVPKHARHPWEPDLKGGTLGCLENIPVKEKMPNHPKNLSTAGASLGKTAVERRHNFKEDRQETTDVFHFDFCENSRQDVHVSLESGDTDIYTLQDQKDYEQILRRRTPAKPEIRKKKSEEYQRCCRSGRKTNARRVSRLPDCCHIYEGLETDSTLTMQYQENASRNSHSTSTSKSTSGLGRGQPHGAKNKSLRRCSPPQAEYFSMMESESDDSSIYEPKSSLCKTTSEPRTLQVESHICLPITPSPEILSRRTHYQPTMAVATSEAGDTTKALSEASSELPSFISGEDEAISSPVLTPVSRYELSREWYSNGTGAVEILPEAPIEQRIGQRMETRITGRTPSQKKSTQSSDFACTDDLDLSGQSSFASVGAPKRSPAFPSPSHFDSMPELHANEKEKENVAIPNPNEIQRGTLLSESAPSRKISSEKYFFEASNDKGDAENESEIASQQEIRQRMETMLAKRTPEQKAPAKLHRLSSIFCMKQKTTIPRDPKDPGGYHGNYEGVVFSPRDSPSTVSRTSSLSTDIVPGKYRGKVASRRAKLWGDSTVRREFDYDGAVHSKSGILAQLNCCSKSE